MTGLARSTIYALIANGEFPSPFKLSSGTSAWLESDIQTWLRGRVEASRAAAAGAKWDAPISPDTPVSYTAAILSSNCTGLT